MNPFRIPGRVFRKAGALLLLFFLLGLAGCSPHRPAPVETREAAPAKPVENTAKAKKADRYRVRKGDTLYGIAWRYGLDFTRLASWNGITKPYRIYPGQILRLTSPPKSARKGPPRKFKPVAAEPKPATRTAKAPAPKTQAPPPRKPAAPKPKPKPAGMNKSKGGAEPLRWRWPTSGAVVQTFRKGDKTRQGIRIAGRSGQPVLAAETGRVVYSGSGLPGYGKLIIIKHNKNYLSAYGFNRKILVRDGDSVTRGEQVAEMGQSAGGKSLLHFEIRRSDQVLDPLRVLPKR